MKLIIKSFILSFFIVLISGCTSDVKNNYEYVPYQSSYKNNEANNYIKPSDAYENTPVNDINEEKQELINISNIVEEKIESEPIEKACCKYCSKGKACGDSCISRSYTCHKGPGCACDM